MYRAVVSFAMRRDSSEMNVEQSNVVKTRDTAMRSFLETTFDDDAVVTHEVRGPSAGACSSSCSSAAEPEDAPSGERLRIGKFPP